MNDLAIRQDQEAHFRAVEGRRPTLRRPVKPNQPKGHEAFLKALEASGVNVTFVIASSGEHVTGKIKTSDKYTVSVAEPIDDTRYQTRVLFKHDISEFQPIIVAAQTAGE